MQPRAIHHVSINVADVEASVAFYTGSLGAVRRTDRPDLGIGGAWLDVGGQQLHLIEAPTPPNLGQHFAMLVDDIDATVAELREAGLAVGDPAPVGTGRQAFLDDPDGNVVEIHQAAATS